MSNLDPLIAELEAGMEAYDARTARRLTEAYALLDAWCAAAEDGEALGPLREQTLGWLG